MSWQMMIGVHKLRKKLSPCEYRVAMVLADHARDDGTNAWPAVQTIAEEGEMAEKTVSRAFAVLMEKGVVSKQREATATHPHVWRLHVKVGLTSRLTDAAEDREIDEIENGRGQIVPRGHSVLGGGTSCPNGGDKLSPEPVLQPIQRTCPESPPKAPQGGRTKLRKGIADRKSDPDFNAFYQAYPRKVNPDEAFIAWQQVVRRGAAPADIMAGLARYPFSSDPQFIKHPASWLRAGAWDSEAPQAAPDLLTTVPHPLTGAKVPTDPRVKIEASTGKPTVNGYYIAQIAYEAALEADLEEPESKDHWKPVIPWLEADIDPDDILGVIRNVARRGMRLKPHSLAFFDRAVREAKR